MITQGENESRLTYLLRVAADFAQQNAASVIDYDKTTCDGDCLSHELRNEIETLEAIQRELAEAREQRDTLAEAIEFSLSRSLACGESEIRLRNALAAVKGGDHE